MLRRLVWQISKALICHLKVLLASCALCPCVEWEILLLCVHLQELLVDTVNASKYGKYGTLVVDTMSDEEGGIARMNLLSTPH